VFAWTLLLKFFSLGLELGNFFAGTFVWELLLGSFGLGTLAWLPGEVLCNVHMRTEQINGRVDSPVPPAKLREFMEVGLGVPDSLRRHSKHLNPGLSFYGFTSQIGCISKYMRGSKTGKTSRKPASIREAKGEGGSAARPFFGESFMEPDFRLVFLVLLPSIYFDISSNFGCKSYGLRCLDLAAYWALRGVPDSQQLE
jgi:hypothetical protein